MHPTSFGLIGKVVSEEKIFLEIIQSETRIVYGGYIC
jgi:RNase P/RNase MRP subunit p29